MAESLTASMVDSIRSAAKKLTGFPRRQFQAEMTVKYCDGSVVRITSRHAADTRRKIASLRSPNTFMPWSSLKARPIRSSRRLLPSRE